MKHKISLRMRVTLITVATMTIICLVLSFFILRNVSIQVVLSADIDPSFQAYSSSYSVDTSTKNAAPLEFDENKVTVLNVDAFYKTCIFIVATVIVLGSVAIYFIIGASLKPVETLQKKVATIDGADMTKRIEHFSAGAELDMLANSFNQLLDRLESVFEREKSFSAGAAHELKTPLAVIKTNLDVLSISNPPTTEEYEETLSIVKKQTDRMTSLVNDLFAMCALNGYQISETVPIKELLSEIVSEQKAAADEKRIVIDIHGFSCDVCANTVMLKHAFSNLVQNAIKYNVEGGRIYIETAQQNGQCVIRISDTGIGISPSAASHIFEPFYREDKSRSRKVGGAGLGLSIVKNIVEQHGGTVSYQPNHPVGAVFSVSLPIQ